MKTHFLRFSIFFIFLLVVALNQSFAQCTGGTDYGTVFTSPGMGNNVTVPNVEGGQYVLMYVCAGSQYTVATCGQSDFDTEITILQADGSTNSPDIYDDNGCGDDQASITFTVTGTGYIRILLTYVDPTPVTGGPCANTTILGLNTTLTITQDSGSDCAPVGFDCNYADPITTVPYSQTGLTTCNLGNDYDSNDACGSTYMDGDDYVFTFSPPQDGCYTFSLSNNPDATGLFLLDGCPDAGAACISSETQAAGNPSLLVEGLLASQTYYLIVSTSPALVGGTQCTNFDIAVDKCIDGITCSTPIEVTTTPYNYSGTTEGFIDNYSAGDVTAPCDGNANYIGGDDIVFEFTPNTSDCYQITLSNTEATADVGIFIYTGGCPTDGGTCFASTTADNTAPALYSDLSANTTYYIIIATWPTPQVTVFDMLIDACPPGVSCSSPFDIPPASLPSTLEDLSTCTMPNSYTAPEGCAVGNNGETYSLGNDMMFSFTPTTTGCYIFDLDEATGGTSDTESDAGIFVFDNCPTSGNCIAGETRLNGFPNVDAELTAGTTYYIMVSSDDFPECIDFNLVIKECPPATPAQDCIGAIPVCTAFYDQSESFIGEGSVSGEVAPNTCLATGERNSVWYVITVQEAGELNFTITPKSVLDDYDWALYDITDGGCAGIKDGTSPQISCNYSISAGVTGTQPGSTQTTADQNASQFNGPLPVEVGDVIMLNISNFSNTQGGYELDFEPYDAVPNQAGVFDDEDPKFKTVETAIPCGANSISVAFSEPILCNTVETCDFALTGPGGPYTVQSVSGTNCDGGGTFEKDFIITVSPNIIQSGDFVLGLLNPADGSCGIVTDNCGNQATNEDINFSIINIEVRTTDGPNETSCTALGSITVEGFNGTSPYQYALDGGTFQATGEFTDLAAGTYTILVQDNDGCQIETTVTIQGDASVPEQPAATSPDPICVGEAVPDLTATSTTGTLTWYDEDPTVGTPTSVGTGSPFSPTVDNTTAGTTTFWVTAEDGNCVSPATEVTVTVIDNPATPTATSPDAICTGETVPDLTATGGAGTLTWYATDPTIDPTSVGTGSPFATGLDNTTAGDFNYWVREVAGSCISDATQVTITVNQTPTDVTATSPDPICIGEAVPELTATGGDNGTITWYDFNPDSGNPTSIGTGSPFTPPADNNTVGEYDYWATAVNGDCETSSVQVTITVIDNPVAPTATSPDAICTGDAVPDLTATGGGGTLEWYDADPTVGTPVSVGSGSPFATGLDNTVAGAFNYWVREVAGSCISEATQVTITINQTAAAPTAESPAAICKGQTIPELTATGTGNGVLTWYDEDPSGGTATAIGTDSPFTPTLDNNTAATTSYWVTEVSGDCEGEATEVQIIINDTPTAPTAESPDAICLEEAAPALTATGTGNGTITWYDADPSGGTAAAIGTDSPFTPPIAIDVVGTTSYWVTEVLGDCESEATQIEVEVKAVPIAAITAPESVCADGEQTITIEYDATNGTVNDAATANFIWGFGGGVATPGDNSAGPHEVSFTGSGSATITLSISENGCESPQESATITLEEELAIPSIICGDATPTSVSFTWGDIAGATGYEVVYSGAAAGNETIQATNFEVTGLTEGDEVTITVAALGDGECGNSEPSLPVPCIASPCPANPIDKGSIEATYCQDDEVVTLNESPTGVTFSGDGVTGNTFDPSQIDAGETATITFAYDDGNGCTYTLDHQVTIKTVPTADFTVDPGEACADGSTAITVTYTGDGTTAANFLWDFDGGTATDLGGEMYEVTWSSPGTKTISLTVEENGCQSQPNSEVVTILAPVDPPAPACGVATPTSVEFTWGAVNGATDYEITIDINGGGPSAPILTGGATSYTEENLVPTDQVTITVVAISDAICGNSEEGTITCEPEGCPEIDLQIVGLDAAYCSTDGIITLTSNPEGAEFSGPGVADGRLDTEAAGAGGTVTATYIDPETACEYEVTQDFTINPQPVAGIDAPDAVCADGESTIQVEFTGQAGAGATYNWNFGGGVANGSGAGPYSVSFNGGGATATISLTVIENGCESEPVSADVDLTQPLDPPTVTCGQGSTSSVVFEWDAVDGATGYNFTLSGATTGTETGFTGTSYEVTGLNEGDVVTIALTAVGDGACGNAQEVEIACEANSCPADPIDLTSLPGEICANDGAINLTAEPAGVTYSGTGVTGTSFDPAGLSGPVDIVVSYVDPVEATCTYEQTHTITVNPQPTADFTVDPMEVCADGESFVTVTYTGDATTAANFDWGFGGGNESALGGESYQVTFNPNVASPVTIRLVVTENGCASEEFTVDVTLTTPLEVPVINCVETTDQIEFTWDPVAGAESYEYSIDGGAFIPTTDLGYTEMGLEVNTDVTITVVAVSSAACGNSEPADLSCTTQDCPTDIEPQITNLPANICQDAAAIALTATPPGGTFSGSGVTNGEFNPAGQDGRITITYDYIDLATGCEYSVEANIEVIPPLQEPVVTCGTSTTSSVEFNWTAGGATDFEVTISINGGAATPVTPTGPTNHTVTGLSVNDEVTINVVGVGTAPCTNSTAGTQTCTAQDCPEVTIVINNLEDGASYCADASQIVLSATPAGGTWSGDGIAADDVTFDPSLVQAANTTILYTYIEGDCEYSATRTVTILPPFAQPAVDCNVDGNGDVVFNWNDVGANNYLYTVTVDGIQTDNGTTTSTTFTVPNPGVDMNVSISVVPEGIAPCNDGEAGTSICTTSDCPDVIITINGLNPEYCSNDAPVTVTAEPAGGTFSGGGGVASGTFDPAFAPAGTSTVTYTYIDVNTGCDYTETFDVEIIDPLPRPLVNCDGTTTSSVTFTWGAVTGATDYQVITTVNGGTPNAPENVTGTTHTVTGLTVNDEVVIEVIALGTGVCGNSQGGEATCIASDCPTLTPALAITNLNPVYCSNEPTVVLEANYPAAEVTFEGDGVANGIFDPSLVTGTANIVVNYIDPDTNCPYSASAATEVFEPLDQPNVTCIDQSTADVTFSWDAVAGANDYTIVTTLVSTGAELTNQVVTDLTFTQGGLAVNDEVTITVIANGVNTCGDSPAGTASCIASDCPASSLVFDQNQLNASYCANDVPITLVATPTGGTFSGSGVTGDSFDPAQAGTGNVTITYDYIDPATNCPYSLAISTSIVEPLGQATVICGTTTESSVAFSWNDVAGATGYQVVTTLGGVELNNTTTTATTWEEIGLSVNDAVSIIVTPLGSAPCGDGPASAGTTCTANDCPAQPVSIDNLLPQYCGSDTPVELIGTPAGGVFSSNEGVIETDGVTFDPSQTTAENVTIVYTYTDPATNCEYQTSATTQILPPFTAPTVECTSDQSSVTFTWSDVGATDYQIIVTIDGTPQAPQTVQGLTYTESGLAVSIPVSIEVVAVGVNPCPDSQVGTAACVTGGCSSISLSIDNLNAEYCNTDAPFVLTGTPAGGTFSGPGVDETTNTFDPSAGPGGTITYDYTDPATGCEYSTDTITTVILPLPIPVINCADQTTTSVTFSWTDLLGVTDYQIVTTLEGTELSNEVVTGTSFTQNGLTVGDTVNISVIAINTGICGNSLEGTGFCIASSCPANPIVFDQNQLNESYCADEPTVTLVATPAGGTFSGPGVTAEGVFDPAQVNAPSTDIVYEYINGQDGCSYTASISTIILPPYDTPEVLCESTGTDFVTFTWATVGSAEYNVSVSINGGAATTQVITTTTYTQSGLNVNDEVTITVSAVGIAPCGDSDSDTQTCTANDCPVVNPSITSFTTSDTFCDNATEVTLGAEPAGGTFTGTAGVSNGLFNPLDAGIGTHTITYEYTDPATGCVYTTQEDVNVSNVNVNTIPSTSIDLGDVIDLVTTAFSGLGGNLTYNWVDSLGNLSCTDCESPTAEPTEAGNYQVIVTDEFGCSATETVFIGINPNNKVMMPTAFSPNGDGKNDVLRLYGSNIETVSYHIFNRWGQEVYKYEGNDIVQGWDGKQDGEDVEINTYVYYIVAKFKDGQERIYQGNVVLFR